MSLRERQVSSSNVFPICQIGYYRANYLLPDIPLFPLQKYWKQVLFILHWFWTDLMSRIDNKNLVNNAGMQHETSLCLGIFKFILQSNTAISSNEQVIILFIGFTWSGIEDYTGVILLKLTKSFESALYMCIL